MLTRIIVLAGIGLAGLLMAELSRPTALRVLGSLLLIAATGALIYCATVIS